MEKHMVEYYIIWSDIIPFVRYRARRTTATVEAENNIVKNMDQKKEFINISIYHDSD